MSSIRIDASDLSSGLEAFAGKVDAAVRIYAETVAKDFEGHARSHRPWTDRTSRARQGLTGYVQATDTGYRIVIAHTVDYGIWLELAKEKRYAILEPTVRLKGPEVVRGLEHLLTSLRR